jgi:hypothetical protein
MPRVGRDGRQRNSLLSTGRSRRGGCVAGCERQGDNARRGQQGGLLTASYVSRPRLGGRGGGWRSAVMLTNTHARSSATNTRYKTACRVSGDPVRTTLDFSAERAVEPASAPVCLCEGICADIDERSAGGGEYRAAPRDSRDSSSRQPVLKLLRDRALTDGSATYAVSIITNHKHDRGIEPRSLGGAGRKRSTGAERVRGATP